VSTVRDITLVPEETI